MKLNGWSIENRLYAEDPISWFLARPLVVLARYRPPAEVVEKGLRHVVRNDTGCF